MDAGTIFALAIAAVILWQAIVWPKTAHFFVVTRWGGERTGRIIREKVGLIIPFFESGIWVNQELDEIPFNIRFTSIDNLQIRIAGGIHHYPDHRISDKDGKNVFVGVSPEVFVKGIVKAVESNIAQIGGKMKGKDFIKDRDKVLEVINTMVRMSKPPHMRHKAGERPLGYDEPPYEDQNKLIICGNKDCKFNDGIISVDDLADFLDKHWPMYFEANRAEKKNKEDHSRLEGLYGMADLVLAPFRETSGSGTLAQAFARGMPVLASDLPLNQEITEREPGCLAFFRSEDPEDCAVKVKELLANDPARETLKAAARRYAEKCAPARIAEEHVRFYQEVLNGAMGGC